MAARWLRLTAALLCAAAPVHGLINAPGAEAAIALRAAAPTGGGTTSYTSFPLTRPTGTLAGDVMVATVVAAGGGAIVTPTGWIAITGLDTASGTALRVASFYRVATSGDPASWTAGLGSARVATGGVVAYSGADQANPIDKSDATSGASGTATAPALTTSHLDARVISIFGFAVSNNASVSAPAGVTQRISVSSSSVPAGVYDANQAEPGTATAVTTSASRANTGWVGQRVALNEEPALTAGFPTQYAWGSWGVGANTSAEQVLSVTSNRLWGVKLRMDHADGRMTEWNGTSYLSRRLASPLQWRLSSLAGVAQSTTFAPASSTSATVLSGRAAATTDTSLGITFSQPVSYSDDASLNGNSYRTVVSYDAAQGF